MGRLLYGRGQFERAAVQGSPFAGWGLHRRWRQSHRWNWVCSPLPFFIFHFSPVFTCKYAPFLLQILFSYPYFELEATMVSRVVAPMIVFHGQQIQHRTVAHPIAAMVRLKKRRLTKMTTHRQNSSYLCSTPETHSCVTPRSIPY
jgi:hypothetical protein